MAQPTKLATLNALPDGAVVWDAWMKKQTDASERVRRILQQSAVNADDPQVIAAQLSALFPNPGWLVDVALAVLRWHGAAALPVIECVLDLHALKRSGDLLETCIRLLQAIHGEAATDRLLGLLKHADARDAIERHAARWPIWVLRKLLRLKPARNHPAAELLQRLLHEHPDWLQPLRAACDDGERQTLERLLEPRERVEDAPESALPDLLRNPPWNHRASLPSVPELRLEPIERIPVLHWESWKFELGAPDPKGHYFLEGHASQVELVFAKHSDGAPAGASQWDLTRKALWNLGLDADSIETALQIQRVEPGMFGPKRYAYYEPWRFLWNLPPPLALSVLEHTPVNHLGYFPAYEHGFARLLHWLGPGVLPSMRRWIPRLQRDYMPLFQCIEWSALAAEMAQLYCRNRWRRDEAVRWLNAYPHTAARALLPIALGTPGTVRDIARQTLREMTAQGQRAVLDEVVAEYGATATAACAALLAIAPEHVLPDKLPGIPKKLFLPGLPRLLLRDDGRALPVAQLPDALMCLALSTPDQPYPGLLTLQAVVTPDSLARFARALFAWWLDQGAPSRERWMFAVQGMLGDDETARVLAAALRQWRAELIRVRAYDGLDMLGRIGSDAALMHLHSLAAQTRYRDLTSRAQALIAEIAEARGLGLDELADRSVPDLGLDADGRLELDFGPRRFSIHFDELLNPYVKDTRGLRLKDLPKPNASDDATLGRAAVQQYKDLKKQARSLATLQLKRLERAMCDQRRWSLVDFSQLLLRHPLLRNLAQRLLWALYDDDDMPLAAFRAAEDLSLADRNDEVYTPAADARIGIAHPARMPADVLADFSRMFADYKIGQPFAQLAREVYVLAPGTGLGAVLPEWAGRCVTVGSLLGLEQRGWNRSVGDGGMIDALVKPLGNDLAMELQISSDEGWFVGSPAESSQVHEIVRVGLIHANHRRDQPPPTLAQLSAVQFSELQRDLHLMAWFVD